MNKIAVVICFVCLTGKVGAVTLQCVTMINPAGTVINLDSPSEVFTNNSNQGDVAILLQVDGVNLPTTTWKVNQVTGYAEPAYVIARGNGISRYWRNISTSNNWFIAGNVKQLNSPNSTVVRAQAELLTDRPASRYTIRVERAGGTGAYVQQSRTPAATPVVTTQVTIPDAIELPTVAPGENSLGSPLRNDSSAPLVLTRTGTSGNTGAVIDLRGNGGERWTTVTMQPNQVVTPAMEASTAAVAGVETSTWTATLLCD